LGVTTIEGQATPGGFPSQSTLDFQGVTLKLSSLVHRRVNHHPFVALAKSPSSKLSNMKQPEVLGVAVGAGAT